MINAMTVDLEDWHHSIETIPVQDWDKYESRLEKNTKKILNIFEEFDIKATFFVLGYVAEKYPHILRDIHKKGHEIGTHGYGHRLVYTQTPTEFRNDLKKAIKSIESVTGEEVIGYRAPYWTITKESIWALDILQEEGIKYDSSIYPIKTYLYGIPESPAYPYLIKKSGNKLIEYPPATVKVFGFRVPVGGGFYMRALPIKFINWGIKRINEMGHPAIMYIHPPEFDSKKPFFKMALKEKILHYYNLGVIEDKIKFLLMRYKFAPIREIARLYEL